MTRTKKVPMPYTAKPCVGCAYCCQKVPCSYGVQKHGRVPGPCRSLVWVVDRWRCGIYLAANEALRRIMEYNLGIGAGCSSPLFNTERDAQIQRLRRQTA